MGHVEEPLPVGVGGAGDDGESRRVEASPRVQVCSHLECRVDTRGLSWSLIQQAPGSPRGNQDDRDLAAAGGHGQGVIGAWFDVRAQEGFEPVRPESEVGSPAGRVFDEVGLHRAQPGAGESVEVGLQGFDLERVGGGKGAGRGDLLGDREGRGVEAQAAPEGGFEFERIGARPRWPPPRKDGHASQARGCDGGADDRQGDEESEEHEHGSIVAGAPPMPDGRDGTRVQCGRTMRPSLQPLDPRPRSWKGSGCRLTGGVRRGWIAGLCAALLVGAAAPGVVRHERTAVDGVGVHTLDADLSSVSLRVLDSRDHGAKALTAREFLERTGATAVWNGPFFDVDGAPMGLLVVDGKVLQGLRPVDWGVFYVDAEGARIVHTDRYGAPTGVRQAIQVGPRLVVDGKALALKPQSARRAALCVRGARDLRVLVSEGPLAAASLAARFVDDRCKDALNLDGGPSAQLAWRGPQGIEELAGGVPVPIAMGLFTSSAVVDEPARGCGF